MKYKNWSEKFNALSPEIRKIGSASEAQIRIQHLNFEKDRLRKRYAQSLREINEHIKNCEQWLKELEKEIID
jgi:hypothetical protein